MAMPSRATTWTTGRISACTAASYSFSFSSRDMVATWQDLLIRLLAPLPEPDSLTVMLTPGFCFM